MLKLKKAISGDKSDVEAPNAHNKLNSYYKENEVPELKGVKNKNKNAKNWYKPQGSGREHCCTRRRAVGFLVFGLVAIAGGIVANQFMKGDNGNPGNISSFATNSTSGETPKPTAPSTGAKAQTTTCSLHYESVLRVSCGSSEESFLSQTNGEVFTSDTAYIVDSSVTSVGTQVIASEPDYVGSYRQWNVPTTSESVVVPAYNFPVLAAGDYLVTLSFVNPDSESRVFSVLLQDAVVLDQLDISNNVGVMAMNASATVGSNRLLKLDFIPVVGGPLINSIEVYYLNQC